MSGYRNRLSRLCFNTIKCFCLKEPSFNSVKKLLAVKQGPTEIDIRYKMSLLLETLLASLN